MKKKNYGIRYSAPLGIWITLFFAVPTFIIFIYSFLKKGLYGGVIWEFTLDSYTALVNNSFLKVVIDTLYISAMSSFLTIIIALPAAYYMARSRFKSQLMFLIMVPFWTNFLIRVYAWMAILGNNGLVNNFLMNIGMLTEPARFLYNQNAVILVIVYTYLPYAILPLYATIEKFDFTLLEAAYDLGASKMAAMFKVLIPNIKSGITTAVLFTFIPALGSYAIPQLIGNKDSYMIGNVIERELNSTRNWPLASSISVILTLITLIGVLIFLKVTHTTTRGFKRIEETDEELSEQ